MPHLDEWDEKDKGHAREEWLIGMIEIRGKGYNTEVFRNCLQWIAQRDPQNSLRA